MKFLYQDKMDSKVMKDEKSFESRKRSKPFWLLSGLFTGIFILTGKNYLAVILISDIMLSGSIHHFFV